MYFYLILNYIVTSYENWMGRYNNYVCNNNDCLERLFIEEA